MNATAKILTYELRDVVRSKWVIAYALFFLVVTEGLFRFGGGSAKALLSLMNVVLIIIPLVSIVFGTMYLYNARDFIELLLAQPVNRKHLFAGLYTGLAVPLSAGFLAGVSLPFFVHGVQEAGHYQTLLLLALAGTALTFIFVALAFLIAVRVEDKVRGLGTSLLLWLFFSVVYDGLLLVVVNAFADYPLETATIALSTLNPIDLARVLLLMTFDISALMGYTGAIFEAFFGSALGLTVSAAALLVWIAVPFALGRHYFRSRDF